MLRGIEVYAMADRVTAENTALATSFPELQPHTRVLMGPGPSNVNSRVMRAMAAPVVGHLDPDFVRVMDDIKKLLRIVFRTGNEITFPVSGTGSAGMESAIANLIEAGDEAVIGVNGVFGTLMVLDAVTSLGCIPVEIDQWQIDACYSCTQKGISAPPGLAPLTLSERA